MEASAVHHRLRWLLTFAIVGISLVALILWWRASSAPDPAVLLPAPSPAQPHATADAPRESARIGVDVVGAVQRPGLYYLQEGSRVDDAIKAAGGFAPDANRDAINVATRLKDEQQLRVPRVGEASGPQVGEASGPRVAEISEPPESSAAAAPDATGRLNLNTADAQALEKLPGIGPARAQLIVEYRAAHGPFRSVDQLQDVQGIGAATVAALRDLVTVEP